MNQRYKPWLHFFLMGLLLFALRALFFPEPKLVIGPLSEARITALRERWLMNVGQYPSAEETAGMIAEELDRDMLVQRAIELELHLRDPLVVKRLAQVAQALGLAEGASQVDRFEQALALDLHRSDGVVKERLVQLMKQRLLIAAPPPEPESEQLTAMFAQRSEELATPALYSLDHVFLPPETEPGATRISDLIATQRLDFEAASKLAAPFLHGNHFRRQSLDQLERLFGQEFVRGLERADLEAGSWRGAVRSVYGLHYVWIHELEPAREVQFAEVEERLLRDLRYSLELQALEDAIALLRSDYDLRAD